MFVMIKEKNTKYFIIRSNYLTNHHKYIIYQPKHMSTNNNPIALKNHFITLLSNKEVSNSRNIKNSLFKK